MSKPYLQIISKENESLVLRKVVTGDIITYKYDNYGTKFKISEDLRDLTEKYNGKIIMTEPDWYYE